MDEQEFRSLDYLSHIECEGATLGGQQFFVLTLGLTAAGVSADEDQRMIRFVLNGAWTKLLARALDNATQGIPTISGDRPSRTRKGGPHEDPQ